MIGSWFYATLLSNWISRLSGYAASIPLPVFFREMGYKGFASVFGINLSEVEKELKTFRSFNAFFTRSLRSDKRPISHQPGDVVSPVDGTLLIHGPIENGNLIQAKGVVYSITHLLGYDASAYNGGYFLTFYLSPKDCHRVFCPVDGQVSRCVHIPSRLFPVREPYISGLEGLYTKNERLTTVLETPKGDCAVVQVGATNVGAMTTTYDTSVVTNCGKIAISRTYPTPFTFKKGDWIGTFYLGSTVVLCFQKGVFTPHDQLKLGPIKYGETIGQLS
jgi:phosphatidylserine decarboxylase